MAFGVKTKQNAAVIMPRARSTLEDERMHFHVKRTTFENDFAYGHAVLFLVCLLFCVCVVPKHFSDSAPLNGFALFVRVTLSFLHHPKPPLSRIPAKENM